MENIPMNIINNMFKFNFFKRIQTIQSKKAQQHTKAHF